MERMNLIGKRIAESRKRVGLGQIELAVALGDRYDQAMISRVERGSRNLRLDGAVRAAEELGVSLDYLVGLTDDPTPAAQRNSDPAPAATNTAVDAGSDRSARPVDVLEVMACAGDGIEAYDETPAGVLWFRADWLLKHRVSPKQCQVITVRGESMEPTLPDGCSILVDRSRKELQPRRIYVLRNEDGVVVKRAAQNREGWWLTSDNPAWLPVLLTEEADIVGEVRWVARTF